MTYYAAAFITEGVYSTIIITGWTIFALCSPVLAFFTWMTKEKGLLSKIMVLSEFWVLQEKVDMKVSAFSFTSPLLIFGYL